MGRVYCKTVRGEHKGVLFFSCWCWRIVSVIHSGYSFDVSRRLVNFDAENL